MACAGGKEGFRLAHSPKLSSSRLFTTRFVYHGLLIVLQRCYIQCDRSLRLISAFTCVIFYFS